MANPNPTKKMDYRTIKNPNLRTRDVLIWIYKENINGVIGKMVAEQFDLVITDGTSRLATLKKWGCLRIKERGRGNQPFIYEITDWGIKMAKKWKNENE